MQFYIIFENRVADLLLYFNFLLYGNNITSTLRFMRCLCDFKSYRCFLCVAYLTFSCKQEVWSLLYCSRMHVLFLIQKENVDKSLTVSSGIQKEILLIFLEVE